MYFGLIIILLLVLILPFTVRKVEHNLEYFLFLMGLLAVIVSGILSLHLIEELLSNKLLYFITFAVLGAGLLFMLLKDRIRTTIHTILKYIPIQLFVFLLIVVLGLASSVITAIIAALLLVEIVNVLPLNRKTKVRLVILSCFSIGLGAALTPVGEPLSTIVVSRLDADFGYLARLLYVYVIPGILSLACAGAFVSARGIDSTDLSNRSNYDAPHQDDIYFLDSEEQAGQETYREVFLRAFKIFIFVFALELLGSGFKPLIDTYVINLDSRILYFINMLSAVLDNATLAAAEISISMTPLQIKAVLVGLLISGGMLIPGNIPNIISAHKLKITSKEWAVLGIPVGISMMLIYFVVIFLLPQ